MLKNIFIVIFFASLASGCKKENNEKKTLNYNLEYEVITSSGNWFGEYIDSTGTKLSSNGNLPSHWRYKFKLKSLPFDLHVDATTTCSCQSTSDAPNITINFYSNGEVFKTSTNTWAKGVASLDFHMQ